MLNYISDTFMCLLVFINWPFVVLYELVLKRIVTVEEENRIARKLGWFTWVVATAISMLLYISAFEIAKLVAY